MSMTLITGKMNNGKTLVSTFYALKDFHEGRKIITNYNINIPHYEINKDALFWMAETQPSTAGISFFFDELWLWIDSRNAMGNKVLTYFFLQSSKGFPETRVYMTSQKDSQLDMRIRENAHILIECERKLLLNNKMCKVKSKVRDLGNKFYPYLYIKVSEFEQGLHGLYKFANCVSRFYIKADWIFKFYDTHQKMRA